MASNEKVVLCGIISDKENAPNLKYLKRMEDGTFFGDTMQYCIDDLVLIDDYINDGDIFIDFVNKEVWVYTYETEYGGCWMGPQDTQYVNEFADYNYYISVEDYKNNQGKW